jgi:hypothetical protein
VIKYFTIIILAFIVSCSTNDIVTLSYSGIFKLNLQSEVLSGGTIFYSDELSVKTNDGKVISGLVISVDSEGLPESFDIRQYPEYLLGLKNPNSQSSEVNKLFLNSLEEIKYVYSLDNLKVKREEKLTIYSLCKERSCLAFIVKNGFDEHIFTIHAKGYTQLEFDKLLEGAVHVES